MRFTSYFVLALAAEVTVASNWFSKAVYNKWHESELERWLSDHNIPYPTPADRKDLENLVKDNWQSKIAQPYNDWDTPQLQKYLSAKGYEAKDAAADTKESLVSQVKSSWYEAEDKSEDAWSSVKDWIFDSWTDSQLKAFADKNNIPVPQPRKRDSVLSAIRSNYDSVAKKIGEHSAYPGDWIYSQWSDSDLKEYLDTNGYPAPQPTSRDKLIATVRRNARVASLNASSLAASASSSASAAQESLSDALLDSWSDSKIKEWADENGIKVPQGSKRNELLAIARKHRASLTGGKVTDSVASAFGAATSSAGNAYAQATDEATLKANDLFDSTVGVWSDSRLKAFLDARGVPVPQAGKHDELLAAVRLNKHKAASGWSAWTFDTWTTENLKNWLSTQSDKGSKKISEKTDASRSELLAAAQNAYAEASKTSGGAYASVTSSLAKATDYVKDSTFDTWSDSDLKDYLDSYGVTNYQGSTTNELRAKACNAANYFRYGTTTPQGTLYSKFSDGAQWVLSQLNIGAAKGKAQDAYQEGAYQGEKATDAAKENVAYATNRASEQAQKAKDYVKEEL